MRTPPGDFSTMRCALIDGDPRAAAASRCWSAAPCSISARSCAASRPFRRPIPHCGRGLDARARELGWPALHAELARVDPAAAARIQPADAQRIQRALEVYELTGEALSDRQRRVPGTSLRLLGPRADAL